MKKPVLVIMAAGMGSRYGGLKQLDPVGNHGQLIIDYSIYDARRAGFETVVFVIKHEIEEDFKRAIGDRVARVMDVQYAYQQLDDLPEGYSVPAERTKPWGTAHAALSVRNIVDGPFAVINADDYYGTDAFRVIAEELSRERDRKGDYCMVGFRVGNTMTENGSVSRGVCTADADGYLANVVERTAIAFDDQHRIAFTDENGRTCHLDPNTPVSMNFWGFTPDYFDFSKREFIKFLDARIDEPKSEYYIPTAVNDLIHSGEATVRLLDTTSKWFGVTYAEDRASVVAQLAALHDAGVYPDKLF